MEIIVPPIYTVARPATSCLIHSDGRWLRLLGRPGRRNGGLIRHCRDGDALDRRWHGELRQLLRLDVPRFATTRYENVPDTDSAFFPFATRVAASASTVNPAAERFAMDLDI